MINNTRTLKDFPFNRNNASRESIAQYAHMLENLNRFNEEEADREDIMDLVASEVDFIGSFKDESERIRTSRLRKRHNMMKIVLNRLSSLTYREYLSLFPIQIEFDGDVCALYGNVLDSFIGRVHEMLSELGIDPNMLDSDSTIGENEGYLPGLISRYDNDVLSNFASVLLNTVTLLRNRDKELAGKYSSNELMFNLDVLL